MIPWSGAARSRQATRLKILGRNLERDCALLNLTLDLVSTLLSILIAHTAFQVVEEDVV